jgi:hypothetical protein
VFVNDLSCRSYVLHRLSIRSTCTFIEFIRPSALTGRAKTYEKRQTASGPGASVSQNGIPIVKLNASPDVSVDPFGYRGRVRGISQDRLLRGQTLGKTRPLLIFYRHGQYRSFASVECLLDFYGVSTYTVGLNLPVHKQMAPKES